eukprot:TRINITY_DN2952_c0_g1_i1.p2 TRINITY_DN2952_c0_g1~~TRINITY_DN2952_c0_g1_i1.p2  ORF type:complete len:127 (+),score=24.81 TRINITY_DN2952_c0_g1_i1:179-559(+)
MRSSGMLHTPRGTPAAATLREALPLLLPPPPPPLPPLPLPLLLPAAAETWHLWAPLLPWHMSPSYVLWAHAAVQQTWRPLTELPQRSRDHRRVAAATSGLRLKGPTKAGSPRITCSAHHNRVRVRV